MQSKLNQSNVQNQIEKQNGYSPIDVTLTAIYRLGNDRHPTGEENESSGTQRGEKPNRPPPSGKETAATRTL